MAKSGFRRTKALISLKRSTIGPIGSHVRTFDCAEFNDLDEILEGLLCTILQAARKWMIFPHPSRVWGTNSREPVRISR